MPRFVRALILLGSSWLGAASPSAAAGTAELLKDVNVVEAVDSDGYGVAGPLAPAGDRVVFPGYTPGSGIELWGSDGTSLGTELLREVLPGTASPRFDFVGTVRGAAIFLAHDDGSHDYGLWRSDGTSAGTFQIAQTGRCFDPPRSALLGSFLFFTARASGGCVLWKTDGTAAGTSLVKDIDPGSWDVGALASAGGRLFFFVGSELWISDGTPAGTNLLQSLEERAEDALPELTPAGSRVFFFAPVPGSRDEELWTSDGTPAGTRPVTHFFEPRPFFGLPYENVVTVIGDVLYFLAHDGTGTDLWQSDGTVQGTRRVTDFVEGNPFPREIEPVPFLARLGKRLVFPAVGDRGWRLWTNEGTPETTAPLEGCLEGCPNVSATPLVRIGNRAVFAGTRGEGVPELWVTDGTGRGTRPLAAGLCFCNAFGSFGPALVSLLGKVFFVARGGQGLALWRTDGTPAGTIRLADLGADQFPGPFPVLAGFAPVQAAERIFFAADPGNRGLQLWSSDGTPGGTGLVTLIGGVPSSTPAEITPFAGGTLFTASDGTVQGLWRSDGTAAGTVPIAGATGVVRRLTPSGGLTFFLHMESLWRTDGTEAGTFRVGPMWVDPLVPFRDGVVFLTNSEEPYNTALWQSDGTVAGTRHLLDFVSGPRFLKSLGPSLYFSATGDNEYRQLWVSDGTVAGTRALTDFEFDAFYSFVQIEMARLGGTVFFNAGGRLWKTGGTPASTVPLLPVGQEGSSPSNFVEFHGALFFFGGTVQGSVGRGLWRSDGTAAGTHLVKPVAPFVDFLLEPAWPTILGDRLFFVADDGEHGLELWSTDGTPAGTVLVRDIAPGAASSRPSWLAAANGRLYFAADDGRGGNELWESDGTAAGTRRVQDIAPGGGSSHPKELTVSGNRLFFAADDGVHGEEPWVLDLAGGGCVPAADALCLGGRFRVEATWRDFQGNRGAGRAVALTAETGTFWFFDAANVEVILKVLDGRGLNGHHWVFYGALSNVEYTLTVTDTQTGAVRRYINPPGRLGSLADTEAFGPRGASAAGVVTLGPSPAAAGAPISLLRTAPATGTCVPSAARLCLNGGRFAVEARWKTQGQTSTGQAVSLAGGDTGYFWFFDANNVEVVLKVLDGRPLNGKFWVFYGALSDVEYTLTVTDTETGAVRTYTNPRGRLASVADTGAF